MNMKRPVVLMVLWVGLSAQGLVKAPTPVSDFWGTARHIVVGKITSISDTGNVVASATMVKGESIGDVVRLRVELPELVKQLKQGDPIVLLLARRERYLHVADGWYLPVAPEGTVPPNLFRVAQSAAANLQQSYPGRTATLVRLIEELKANDGKYSMLNAVSPDMFKGGVKDLGAVDAVGAMTLQTLRDAKTQTVIALSSAKMRKFAIESGALKATEAAKSQWPVSSLAAVATVEMNGKRVPVILSRTGELTVDGTPAKPLWTGATANTAAIGNFGEDGSAAAIVITDDQVMRYSLDGSAPPADFVRLTGEKISTYHRDNPKWLAGATARPLDCNGDGRMDVLIVTPAGPMLLINRGFGCFFINPDLGKVLKTESGEALPGKNLWTGADVDGDGNDDLLMIRPDGAASAVLNPKPTK